MRVHNLKIKMSQEFENVPGFCSDCGSVLPPLKDTGGLTCYACSRAFNENELLNILGNVTVNYKILFNSRENKQKDIKAEQDDEEEEDAEGPVIDRKCPKCGNEKMSYATVQLRSADEGQTVFFTCTKCKFKESENS